MPPETYTCATCGQTHAGLPLSFAADFPDPYANLNPDERDARAVIGSDQCIIDQQQFFLRGCLEIPIIGQSEPFLWGLWATVWEKDFDEIADCWETQGRENKHGPFNGRLANSVKDYPETLNLKLKIVLGAPFKPDFGLSGFTVGTRPLFYIEESEHPFAKEQQHGISYQLAMERALF
jgi:hypothetical protein